MYEATQPSDVLRAVDSRLRAVRVLPRTTRPTKKSLAAREKRMGHELEDLEKHIRKNEASPPPPPPLTDTPRVAGRPPRPPRARSVGSLQSGSPPS